MDLITPDSQYDLSTKLSNGKFWGSNSIFEIPYNQRSYSWQKENIKKYLNDIYDYIQNKNSFITFGTYYFLCETKSSSQTIITIWDGQQRIITSYLLLAAIYKKFKEFSLIKEDELKCKDYENKIKGYLFKQYFLSSEEIKKKETDGNEIPKIFSVHPIDNDILCNILNLKINPLELCYTKEKDTGNFACNNCAQKPYTKETGIIKHLLNNDCNKHKKNNKKYTNIIKYYCDPDKKEKKYHENNMIHAFYIMCKFLDKNIGDSMEKLEIFFNIYENSIPHEEFICKNIGCATIIFELLNNRGLNLEQTDIARNYLIKLIDDKYKNEMFNRYNILLKIDNIKHITKNSENILKLIISLTNKKFEQNLNCVACFKELFKDVKNINTNLEKLEKNKSLLSKLCQYIKNNQYSCIFDNDIVFDIFQYIIVPCYYLLLKTKTNEKDFEIIFTNILEIVTCYLIKSSVKYRTTTGIKKTQLIIFANNIINKKIKVVNLEQNLKQLINTYLLKKGYDTYKIGLNDKKMTETKNTKQILFYYEIKNKPKIKMSYNKIELEHIMPKNMIKNNEKLQKVIDLIGNLTLLEKENSEGFYGNASLKDKEFVKKIVEYKKSNISITRKIYSKYKDHDEWTIDIIKERTQYIINKICGYIDNVLDNKSIDDLSLSS
jgi:hypothetical protein